MCECFRAFSGTQWGLRAKIIQLSWFLITYLFTLQDQTVECNRRKCVFYTRNSSGFLCFPICVWERLLVCVCACVCCNVWALVFFVLTYISVQLFVCVCFMYVHEYLCLCVNLITHSAQPFLSVTSRSIVGAPSESQKHRSGEMAGFLWTRAPSLLTSILCIVSKIHIKFSKHFRPCHAGDTTPAMLRAFDKSDSCSRRHKGVLVATVQL